MMNIQVKYIYGVIHKNITFYFEALADAQEYLESLGITDTHGHLIDIPLILDSSKNKADNV